MDKINRLIRKGNLILDYKLLSVEVSVEVRRGNKDQTFTTAGLGLEQRKKLKETLGDRYKTSRFWVSVKRKGAYKTCSLFFLSTRALTLGSPHETLRMNVSKKLFPEGERKEIRIYRKTVVQWMKLLRKIKNRVVRTLLSGELDKTLSRASYLCVLKDHTNKMNQIQGAVSRLLVTLNDTDAELRGLKATLTPYKQVEPYQAILSEVSSAGDNLKMSLECVERCDKELDSSLSGGAFKDEEEDDEDIS